MGQFLGESFAQRIHYFFKDKCFLLIFDDFHLALGNKEVKFLEHIFSSIRQHRIFVMLITEQPIADQSIPFFLDPPGEPRQNRQLVRFELQNMVIDQSFQMMDTMINLDTIDLELSAQQLPSRQEIYQKIFAQTQGNP